MDLRNSLTGLLPTTNGSVLVRAAEAADAAPVTELIHLAYGRWTTFKSPTAVQTQGATETHLTAGAGFVAESDGKIVATITLWSALVLLSQNEITIDKHSGNVLRFTPEPDALALLPAGGPPRSVLFFEKLAVANSFLGSGLGRSLVAKAESLAHQHDACSGICCDVVPKTGWLHEWYLRRGYQPLGVRLRDGNLRVRLVGKLKP